VRSKPRGSSSRSPGEGKRAPRAQVIIPHDVTPWVRGRVLGRGQFGTVYKAFDPNTSRIFAVKEASLFNADGARMHERLDVELKICQQLRHEHIVSYLGHEYTDQHLRIYLEFVPGGSLAEVLREFGELRGLALKKTAHGILKGLVYLHTRSPAVVHRDLKSANVLVDLDMCVKLADFGCSKCSADTRSHTTVGSVPWMAPEVIAQAEGYGRKADIWSFGCTVIEIATAGKPWGDGAFNNIMHAMHIIVNTNLTPPLPEAAPEECRDLVSLCVRRDQSLRATTVDLLRHRFFADL